MTTNKKRYVEIIPLGNGYYCSIIQPTWGRDMIVDMYVADTVEQALGRALVSYGIKRNFRLKS